MSDTPLKSLPHGYPFRFLDNIVELSSERGVAIKNATVNESFFRGHFQENPLMPGVLIVEAMAQLAGLVMNYGKGKETTAFLAQIKDMKLKRPVLPADRIQITAEAKERFSTLANFSVKAMVDTALVAEGELVMAEMMKEG